MRNKIFNGLEIKALREEESKHAACARRMRGDGCLGAGAAKVDGCRSRCQVWEGGKSLGGKIQKF